MPWPGCELRCENSNDLKMGSRCNLSSIKAFGHPGGLLLWACVNSDDVEDGLKMQSRVQGLWPAGLLPLACANSDDFEDGLKWQILTYVDIGGQM